MLDIIAGFIPGHHIKTISVRMGICTRLIIWCFIKKTCKTIGARELTTSWNRKICMPAENRLDTQTTLLFFLVAVLVLPVTITITTISICIIALIPKHMASHRPNYAFGYMA